MRRHSAISRSGIEETLLSTESRVFVLERFVGSGDEGQGKIMVISLESLL